MHKETAAGNGPAHRHDADVALALRPFGDWGASSFSRVICPALDTGNNRFRPSRRMGPRSPGTSRLLEVLGNRYACPGTLLARQVPVEHRHDVVGPPHLRQCHPRRSMDALVMRESVMAVPRGRGNCAVHQIQPCPPETGAPLGRLGAQETTTVRAPRTMEIFQPIPGISNGPDGLGGIRELTDLCRPVIAALIGLAVGLRANGFWRPIR